MAEARLHHRTCSICEAMCGIVIEHRDGQVVSIKPDRDDVLSRGHICPKAVALKDLHEDPDRLRRPMRRTSSGWEEISWAAAFEEIERRIGEVRARHGNDSVALYVGNPTVHNLGAMLSVGDFIRAVRTKNLYSATSVDQLPHMVASCMMFGHQFLMPVPDVDRTQLFVCIGGNPVASGGSLMGAPGFERRVEALRARGGRFVVVDPRRTESADIADEHLPIQPGTDVYLLLGLLHELFAAGLVRGPRASRDARRRRRTAACSDRPLRPAGAGRTHGHRTRARGAPRAGDRRRAPCAGLWPGRSMYAGIWRAHDLARLLSQPADGTPRQRGRHDVRRARGRPDARLRIQGGQVRALISFAGNPVLSTPNGRQLDRALESLEFMVSVDPYLNETTRHADLVLPPTSPLEHSHYDIALSGFAVRNVVKYSPPLFERPADALHDHEILAELTLRLGTRPGMERSVAAAKGSVARRLGPDGLLDWMLRTGVYGQENRGALRLMGRLPGFGAMRRQLEAPDRKPRGLSLKRLRAAPHGIDLGPLEQGLVRRLGSPDRRIQLAPDAYVNDLDRAARALEAPTPSLVLIGRRHVRSNNSWLHNSQRLVKGKPRCTLMIHPADAATRGIVDGCVVRLSSRVGAVEIAAEVTEDMRPGVVCMPHGWGHDRPGTGHDRPGTRLSVAGRSPGVSINDVVDDQRIDELTGTAVLNGTPVEVEPVRLASGA